MPARVPLLFLHVRRLAITAAARHASCDKQGSVPAGLRRWRWGAPTCGSVPPFSALGSTLWQSSDAMVCNMHCCRCHGQQVQTCSC